MSVELHAVRLPFLSRLMLAWQLRHRWQLKLVFPRYYWVARWVWHRIMTAVRGCRVELMPALYVMRVLSVKVCRYGRALVTFVAKHTFRHHSHSVSTRAG